jgi:hypothetical protein
VLGNDGKPLPAAVEMASAAKLKKGRAQAPETAVAQAAPAAGGLLDGGKSLMRKLFKTADAPPAVQVFEPEEPIPSDAPLPPRRAISKAPLRVAALPEDKRRADVDAAAQ